MQNALEHFAAKRLRLASAKMRQNKELGRVSDSIRMQSALVAKGLGTHAIMAASGKSKTSVRRWQERSSSSWRNAFEGFFVKFTRRRLKHGVFHSVVDLQTAINRFIAEHNEVGPLDGGVSEC